MNSRFNILFLFIFLWAWSVSAQNMSEEEVKQQAESRLQTMSPDQIDARIKSLGMTREEAEAKANAYGIDLESYLNKAVPVPQLSAPQATIIVDQKPRSDTTAPAEPVVERKVVTQNPPQNLPPLTPEENQIFGLKFFRSSANTFVPSPSIADKDYVVGAGDVLKISMWGQIQSTEEVAVDNEGRITLSSVGPVLVSGYSLAETEKRIKIALSRSYSGLVAKPPTIFLDLSISKLRPVRVFIMGEVENPGGYFVNNFASVFNSLFVVGGPKASGSFRDVRVIRNNKVIAKVDMYDYLFGSIKTNDLRINDNDIIYVPLKGKTAAIKGEVQRAYTFELLPGENMKKLIEFSGGIRPTVFKDRAQIDRIVPFDQRVKAGFDRRIFDINFSDIAEGKKDYPLEDGDMVTIYSIIEKKENYVTIAGEVRRPGTYQFDKLKTVKDLVMAADSLWPTAYLKRAELTREFPDKTLQMIVLDLERVMANDPAQNLQLQKKDSLRVYSIYELNPALSVAVLGHAKSPGTYPYAKDMTISKILLNYVGLEDSVFRANTFLDRGDIFRLNDDLISRRRIEFNPASLLEGKTPDITIIPGDEIRIYGLNEITLLNPTVQIFGSVKNPGTFNLTRGMTLTDLLLLAGGYTEEAWAVKAEIARVIRGEHQGDSVSKILFAELPDLFDTTRSAISVLSSKAGSFFLNDKDQVYIRPDPDYNLQKLVSVIGEVNHAGTYALSLSRERLSDIIARAGGLKKDGYARGGQLMRDGERMRINIKEALDNEKGKYDAILRPGDQIIIPRYPNTVRIAGEVNNPGAYSFVEGQSMSFYIDLAGGLTDSTDFALVTFPEGYIEKSSLGWFGNDPDIPDGSTIYVTKIKPEPPKPPEKEGKSTFDFVKDMLAIVVSSVTIIVLASKL